MPPRWRLALIIGGLGVIPAALAIVGLTALMTGEPGPRGYVEREATGQLAVGYRSCPGESINEVAVYDLTAPTPVILWKVSRVAEAEVTHIVLGRVPNGFSESSAFVEPVVTHTIRFEIKGTTGAASTVQFEPSKLGSGQYWQAADPEPSPLSKLKRTGSSDVGC